MEPAVEDSQNIHPGVALVAWPHNMYPALAGHLCLGEQRLAAPAQILIEARGRGMKMYRIYRNPLCWTVEQM